MKDLLQNISQCTHCEAFLELGPRPVLAASISSRILIIGQAPGIRVHKSGIPWDDKSGDNLREWLGVSKEQFYNPDNIAIVPMGFCYPGKGKSGDLPPRKECAPLWHESMLTQMKNIQLTLLIGQYAQAYYLKESRKKNLTETVRHFEDYLPELIPLPHPSPRNNIWMRKNPWFKESLIPYLQSTTAKILS